MTAPNRQAQLRDRLVSFDEGWKANALDFLSLAYLFENQTKQRNDIFTIFQKLSGLSSLLPQLQELLSIQPPVISEELAEGLFQSISALSYSFNRGRDAVEQTDRCFTPGTELRGRLTPLEYFEGPQENLDLCLRNIAMAMIEAKVSSLERQAWENEKSASERHRLREVMRRPEVCSSEQTDSLQGPVPPPAIASAPTMTLGSAPSPSLPSIIKTSSHSNDVIELQHPKGFRGRYGHPDYPLLDKQPHLRLQPPEAGLHFPESFEEAEARRYRLRKEGRYPDVSTFGIWPPAFIQPNSVQDLEVKGLMSSHKNAHPTADVRSTFGTPAQTPESTRHSTPIAEDVSNTRIDAPETNQNVGHQEAHSSQAAHPEEPTKESFDLQDLLQAAVAAEANGRQTDGGSETQPENNESTSVQNNPQTTVPTASLCGVETDERLESFILRPTSVNTRDVVEWWYKVQQLPIRSELIRAHLQNLQPGYSVINSIGDLLPEEVRHILITAKNRQGHILSVHRARDVDLATKMGTFKGRSFIFILSTSSPVEADYNHDVSAANANATNPPAAVGGPFGGGYGGLGFGHTNNNGGGLFGAPYTHSASPGSGFGAPEPTTQTKINTLVQDLKKKGDPCQYVDSDITSGGVQHYQSIAFMPPYNQYSFEELQQLDRAAGRGVQSNHHPAPGAAYQQYVSPSTLGGGGLFGNKPAPGGPGSLLGQPRDVPVTRSSTSLFGGNNNAPVSGGLFGGHNDTVRPIPSLFGGRNTTSSGDGLFGNTYSTPATNNAFGALSTASSGGIFPHTKRVNSGLFGGPIDSQSQPDNYPRPFGGSLFGNFGTKPSTATGGGLFNSAAPTTSGSLFGQDGQGARPQGDGGLFGSMQPGQGSFGGFGHNQSEQKPGGLFSNHGNSAASTTAHQPTTGGLFGGSVSTQPKTTCGCIFREHECAHNGWTKSQRVLDGGIGGFGSSTAPGTGSSSGLFAGLGRSATAPQNTPSLFGITGSRNASPAPDLSTTAWRPGTLFGAATAPSSGLFGSGASSTIAAASNQRPSLFGNSDTSAMSSGGLFGSLDRSTAVPPGPSPTTGGLFADSRDHSGPGIHNGLFDFPPKQPVSQESCSHKTTFNGICLRCDKEMDIPEQSTKDSKSTCAMCSDDLAFHTVSERSLKLCHMCADATVESTCIVCKGKMARLSSGQVGQAGSRTDALAHPHTEESANRNAIDTVSGQADRNVDASDEDDLINVAEDDTGEASGPGSSGHNPTVEDVNDEERL